MPKFDSGSFGLANNSVSTIEYKCTTDAKRLASLSRNLFAQTKRVSQKFLKSTDKKPIHTDSTPEYDRIHQDSTKLVTAKKSFIKKRASILKKKALRNKKEKRFAAYDKARGIPTLETVAVDETYSIGTASNVTGVTYNKSGATNNLSTATYDIEFDEDEDGYESDILEFQAEVNERQGPIKIIVENVDDEVDFEKLCNFKQSECPFDGKVSSPLLPCTNDTKSSLKSNRDGYASLSPQSVNSNFSSNSTNRLSSHCARICWNQQKIPKITTYKAEKKSFDSNNNSSSLSHHHSTQPLMTTVRLFHLNAANGWQDLPTFVQYYLISITICLIANLYLQFFR